MATKKKAKTGMKMVGGPAMPVVIVGYEFDDEALDQLIDMTFRMFERMLASKHLIRALHLYGEAQRAAGQA